MKTTIEPRYVALDAAQASAYRDGALDANGQAPERFRAAESGLPCRHCLQQIEAGEDYLLLAHRPFPQPQPYAELGPIFLHARACTRYDGDGVPPMFLTWPRLLLRGYNAQHRIIYGTGQIVATDQLNDTAAALLQRPDVAYAHLRSASNNCFQCRVDAGATRRQHR